MLTIRRTRVLHGPSIWAPVPVILLTVDIGELEKRLRRETPVFFEHLITLVPSLSDQSGVVNQPEGGLRRLLLDRLALALQNLAAAQVAQTQSDRVARAQLARDQTRLVGPDVTYAQTHPTAEGGVYTVVYAYWHDEVGLAAGTLAVRLLNHLIAKSEPDFAFARELEATVVRLVKRHAYRWQTGTILAAAKRRGIPVERLQTVTGFNGDLVQLGQGCYQRRIFSGRITSETAAGAITGTITSETASLAVKIADIKWLTTHLLREAGLPVPDSTVVQNVDGAATAAAVIGYPVVVKPLDACHAQGITIDVRDEAEVREAFPIAQGMSRAGQVVVERFIPGTHHRILVINDQVVGVREQPTARVIGDSRHTVAELIEITNADPRRGVEPDQPLKPITVDTDTHTMLAKQELTLDEIPEAGRVVLLKPFGLPELGGAAIDRTDDIHPDNAAIARQAARVIGLDVAGIDFITPDIAHSAYEQGGAIVEVNSSPGLSGHTHPTEGTPRDVGMAIVDHLFPPGQPARVPIVAVTGTNGKTTTTRLIAHILQTAGKRVGLATTDGIYIDAIKLMGGDRTGPDDARKVLRNPAVDHAVLETAHAGILHHGLGFAECDVAVVTNVAADHLGREGLETVADLAKVKAVVPGAVTPDGASILNADDPLTMAMAEVAGGEIVFFSMTEDNPVVPEHVAQGGRAVVLRPSPAGELLTLLAQGEATAILPAAAIPATLEGRIRVNIANALAASAAAIAQEVPVATIRTALGTFHNSVAQTPGRFNFLEIDGRPVLVDYCHNLHGLEAMADFVQRLAVPHTVAVITMPGDRTDEHITAFGRLAAQIFDELVIWDTRAEYRRGRTPGEVPALLQAAAIAAGLPPEKISHSDDAQEAARIAIAKGGPESLVALLVGSGAGLVASEWARTSSEFATPGEADVGATGTV